MSPVQRLKRFSMEEASAQADKLRAALASAGLTADFVRVGIVRPDSRSSRFTVQAGVIADLTCIL